MIFPLISIAYESKYFVCGWKLWINAKRLGKFSACRTNVFCCFCVQYFFSFVACFVLVYFERFNLKSLMFQQLVFSRFYPFLAIFLSKYFISVFLRVFFSCVSFTKSLYIHEVMKYWKELKLDYQENYDMITYE